MSRLPKIPLLSGLSFDAALALDDVATVKLDAQNNSEQTGSATLFPDVEKSGVFIEVLNGLAGVAPPAHIQLRRCERSAIPAETSSG